MDKSKPLEGLLKINSQDLHLLRIKLFQEPQKLINIFLDAFIIFIVVQLVGVRFIDIRK